MITHNGIYLLHATHHGMPIVAATMGGKMVIGWLLSATLQAIVAAFGAVEGGEVIRNTNDYLNQIATTDPQRAQALAGWLNTYAAEDAHIVYSLIPTLGVVRKITTVGAAAINTGLYINVGDYFKMGFQCDNLPASGYNRVTPYGCTNRMWMRIERQNFIECYMQSQQNIGGCTFAANTMYEMEINTNGTYKIGSQTFTKNGLTATTPNTMWLFKKAGSYNETYTKRIDRYELFNSDGEYRQYLVPFIRNEVNGMLDLLTGDFFPNAMSSGSFTISETPSTP